MGVKQLWTLLGPVGRPVLLETMEGKTMAIDSSIWIYQFQATMRDKDGRALVNAHVLGFLRRICKLLFYGIKPVFVFDGGAPVLKRMTITERKRRKAGAADSHTKVAEKLLAAHMRREAITHVQKTKPKDTGLAHNAPAVITDENVVYLEDLETNAPIASPSKAKTPAKKSTKSPESASKKAKFHDHDPYRLPDVDPASIVQPTSSLAPDPRLATEEELRAFIDAMRPEDFDVNSPAFRDLPTEVQYEIIGDLRLKSRQTSHKRLQAMLRSAPTPLDFSKAQIRNLQQRNVLTQQLLETTDSIGKANVVIPVRIASERNKEYVLVKNQADEGGWVLGIRDDGTQDKPIVIDDAGNENDPSGDEDSDMEMEEVTIPGPVAPDPDLREYHGRMALASIAKRHAPRKPLQRQTQSSKAKSTSQPLARAPLFIDEDADLEAAIQNSLEQNDAEILQRAIESSKDDAPPREPSPRPELPMTNSYQQPSGSPNDSDDDDIFVAGHSRLETALAFANTSPSKRSIPFPPKPRSNPQPNDLPSLFGRPILLTSESSPEVDTTPSGPINDTVGVDDDETEDMGMQVVVPASQGSFFATSQPSGNLGVSLPTSSILSDTDMPVETASTTTVPPDVHQTEGTSTLDTTVTLLQQRDHQALPSFIQDNRVPAISHEQHASSFEHLNKSESSSSLAEGLEEGTRRQGPTQPSPPAVSDLHIMTKPSPIPQPRLTPHSQPAPRLQTVPKTSVEDVSEGTVLSEWGRSPSPEAGAFNERETSDPPAQNDAAHWDAAQEMDVVAEEGDFAQFISQMKGQDLEAARREIDSEIRDLNKQKKVAMRDSEDITQQMISQIMLMLRLFGIPYITAPMEAEAQCAALVSLGLVEGIITDDSDVFLFGGMRVFKNMFNQSKTVECFLLSDLARELSLERDKLIRLAYLLGSDYVEGLPGVGPVVAMELLNEFPGQDGLHKFKEWWQRVQTGKDTPADTKSTFRKRFKRRFKDLYLADDWPNPAVRDAYYHPAVDESEEPFKWGLPDLDGLQQFFHEELSWSQSKVDDLLLPIIRKMGQRGQAAAANKQGTLDNYFDVSLGSGTYAPRRRQAYSSKRLQQVVTDFRLKNKKTSSAGSGSADNEEDGSDGKAAELKNKRKRKGVATEPGKVPTRKRARGGKAQQGRAGKRKKTMSSEAEKEQEEVNTASGSNTLLPPALAAKLRPRPKPNYHGSAAGDSQENEVDDSDGGDDSGSEDEFEVKRR